MRPAGAAGAVFVCGETGPWRDPRSSHTLRPDQRAMQMHLMIGGVRACVHVGPRRCRLEGGRTLANDAPLTYG